MIPFFWSCASLATKERQLFRDCRSEKSSASTNSHFRDFWDEVKLKRAQTQWEREREWERGRESVRKTKVKGHCRCKMSWTRNVWECRFAMDWIFGMSVSRWGSKQVSALVRRKREEWQMWWHSNIYKASISFSVHFLVSLYLSLSLF